MHKLLLVVCLSLAIEIPAHAALAETMTAEQVVEKNIAARGGLQAWRGIKSMTMTGKMDAGGKQNAQLPFTLKLKRPRMSRLELEFAGKTALQVYDGSNGWKVRPFLNRLQVEPFTQAEMQSATEQEALDGLLIDHETKGIKIELAGVEPIEERAAYKLRLTTRDNQVRNIWIDAQTFLEVRVEGFPRMLDGKPHRVYINYRDYRSVGGLMMPFVLETVVENVVPARNIRIETVNLNPNLENSIFAKPDYSGIRAAN